MNEIMPPRPRDLLAAKEISQTRIAEICDCWQSSVSQWHKFPPELVLRIESALGGKLNRHEMRPDVYGIGEEAAA